MSPALTRDERVYLVAAVFDAALLLPPPPADEAAWRDLEAVRAAQLSRTPEQAAEAEAISAVDAFLFGSVLGPTFTPECVPRTADFLNRVYLSSLPYLLATKNRWNRLRPFVVDPGIAPLERSLASIRATDSSYAPSYPSGHAFIGATLAILLAELVPERSAELRAFGRAYGDARVISGVHFPSDVEAGRILAALLVEMMQQDSRFCADQRGARQELRRALGYEQATGAVPTRV